MSLRAHRAGAVRVEPGVRQFVVHGPDGYSLRTQVWVDGAVLEHYPKDGLPGTWRSDEPWTLTVPEGVRVQVGEVIPTVPQSGTAA